MGDIYDLCGPGHECPMCLGNKPKKKKVVKKSLEERVKDLEREVELLKR